jgi:acyl carrier protein
MRERIIKILNDIRPEFDFSTSDNFIEQGLLDSFDIVSLVVAIDNEYAISINGMDILPENFASVDKIEDLLRKKGVRE